MVTMLTNALFGNTKKSKTFKKPRENRQFYIDSVINEHNELVQILKDRTKEQLKPNTKKYHLKPIYEGYDGGYDLLTKCQSCNMLALYEDQPPHEPCNFCDGTVKVDGAGIWEEIDGVYQWNKMKENEPQ